MTLRAFLSPMFCLSLLLPLAMESACVPAVVGGAAATGVGIAEERSAGSALDDASIWTRIKNDMVQKNLDLVGKVGIEVNEGRVLLTGDVPSAELRMEAVKIAWSEQGVREVIDELKVANPSTPDAIAAYSRDTWITAQIKSRMLVDGNIRSINYTVETINSIVYLIGIAQSREELSAVTNIASTVKYVHKVVSYVRLKDAPLRIQSQKQLPVH